MNIKRKIKKVVSDEIQEKVLNKTKILDYGANFLLEKMGETIGQKKTKEHIKKVKKNYLVIKSKSFSLNTVVGALKGKTPNLDDYLGRYQIIDSLGNVKYKSSAKDTVVTNRNILELFDVNECKIGYIKEHLISPGLPIVQKKREKMYCLLSRKDYCKIKRL